VTKRCPAVVAEAMEAHGGAGYIEEGLLPRLFRASPLNAIWEGSGNVIALDILRALGRGPAAAERLLAEVAPVRALSPLAGQALDDLEATLRTAPDEARARGLAERLALLLAARALQAWDREEIATALLRTRLAGGCTFGATDGGLDTRRILEAARLAA
jgi:putative acyl-CoA dehydrogenase